MKHYITLLNVFPCRKQNMTKQFFGSSRVSLNLQTTGPKSSCLFSANEKHHSTLLQQQELPLCRCEIPDFLGGEYRIHGFSEFLHCVVWWLDTGVSEHRAASMFRVEVCGRTESGHSCRLGMTRGRVKVG
jgi:hypothetical protein